MDNIIKSIVPETQQRISTNIERDGDELTVKVRACSALDDELRADFHDEAEELGRESISVRSRTEYSNQGNEAGPDVTVTFSTEDQLDAVDVITTSSSSARTTIHGSWSGTWLVKPRKRGSTAGGS